jgi:hypothetical protein
MRLDAYLGLTRQVLSFTTEHTGQFQLSPIKHPFFFGFSSRFSEYFFLQSKSPKKKKIDFKNFEVSHSILLVFRNRLHASLVVFGSFYELVWGFSLFDHLRTDP